MAVTILFFYSVNECLDFSKPFREKKIFHTNLYGHIALLHLLTPSLRRPAGSLLGGCPTGCFSLKNRHNDLIPANLVPAVAVPFKWHLLAVLPPFVRDSPLFVDLVLQTDVLQHQVYLAR